MEAAYGAACYCDEQRRQNRLRILYSQLGFAHVSEAVPAALPKANNQYRYQLILRAPTTSRMLPPLSAALAANRVPDAMRLSVDIDALSIC